jgi:hypothetical protein
VKSDGRDPARRMISGPGNGDAFENSGAAGIWPCAIREGPVEGVRPNDPLCRLSQECHINFEIAKKGRPSSNFHRAGHSSDVQRNKPHQSGS